MKQELLYVKASDGVKCALWKITGQNTNGQDIYLGHGTFSDKTVMLGIAEFLTTKGYRCWILEWRNHGHSENVKNFNFETIATLDVPAVFEYFKSKNIKQVNCITHSGGGIILTMFLIHYPQYKASIKSIVFFAVQAFGAAQKPGNFLKILGGKYMSAILGKVPSFFGAKTQHETYYTMKPWFNWNLKNSFYGSEINYLNEMPRIATPILSICAQGDTFIAPIYGCKAYLNAFKNKKNKLVYCHINNGFLEKYNHTRIILSKNASKELWPLALAWIIEHNS